ncbi:MAG: hypothetical protein D6706_13070 [Chloroflexi bacterium]|nr:MAG: hypothetical protein D6706_13070 [Chloroflexota bacterium]
MFHVSMVMMAGLLPLRQGERPDIPTSGPVAHPTRQGIPSGNSLPDCITLPLRIQGVAPLQIPYGLMNPLPLQLRSRSGISAVMVPLMA